MIARTDHAIAGARPVQLSFACVARVAGSVAAMVLAVVCPLTVMAAENVPASPPDPPCTDCHAGHGPARLQELLGAEALERRPPAVPAGLERSAHRRLRCVACHAAMTQVPHVQAGRAVACDAACHLDAAAAFRRSVHAEAGARGGEAAPRCTTCHAGHEALRRAERSTPAQRRKSSDICLGCHGAAANLALPDAPAGGQVDRLHQRAAKLGDGGHNVACLDCHGYHHVTRAAVGDSPVARERVLNVCARCHAAVAEMHLRSVHGRGRQQVVCTDCHPVHRLLTSHAGGAELDPLVRECGACHDRSAGDGGGASFYALFHDSYHGLGAGGSFGARCVQCHDAHTILPAQEPASSLHASRRAAVCGQCHGRTDATFLRRDPHRGQIAAQAGAPQAAARYVPLVVAAGVLLIAILHRCLWWWRGAARGVPRTFRQPSAAARAAHNLGVAGAGLLALTGMLLLSDSFWGRLATGIIGGRPVVLLLHMFIGVVLVAAVAAHVLYTCSAVMSRQCALEGPGASLLPGFGDVAQCARAWICLLRHRPPPVLRGWAYWDKCDYWAGVTLVLMLGLSGLALAFPGMSGGWAWTGALAASLHSGPALGAALLLLAAHLVNVSLERQPAPGAGQGLAKAEADVRATEKVGEELTR